MFEIVTEAVVLDKENLGESDSRVFLYAKDLGKVTARVTSARKITSKLSPHLEPFNYITARLVSRLEGAEGQFYQLADSLRIDAGSSLIKSLSALLFFKSVLPNGIPDSGVWDFLIQMVQGRPADLEAILKLLGFDPLFASCEICKRVQPEYFYAKSNFFVCRPCVLNSKEDKINFIKIK